MGADPCAKYQATVGYPSAGTKGIYFQFVRDTNTDSYPLRGKSSLLRIFSKGSVNERSPYGIGTVTGTGEKVDSIYARYSEYGQPDYTGFALPGSRFTVTRFDRANQIISGEFHLILSDFTGRTITLGNGRFDFRFNACTCD